MAATEAGPSRRYETWSAIAFLLAGVLWLLDAVSLIVNQFLSPTSVTTALVGVAFVVGIMLSVIGMVGLYPRLTDKTPRIAMAAVATMTMVGVGLLGIIILSVSMKSLPSFVRVGLFRLLIVLLLVGFLLFGIAGVMSASPSKTIGLLLLGIGTAYAVHFVWNAVQPTAVWRPILSTSAQTILHLAVGYSLISRHE